MHSGSAVADCVQIKRANQGYTVDDDDCTSQSSHATAFESDDGLRLRPTYYSEANAAYQHQSPSASPAASSSHRPVLSLGGYDPGESDVGYENVAFSCASGSIEPSLRFTARTLPSRVCVLPLK